MTVSTVEDGAANNKKSTGKRKLPFDHTTSSTPIKRPHSTEMPPNDQQAPDVTVATLSNMGNTCFLNSVLYMLRFAPSFLHNLHHLIKNLSQVDGMMSQYKVKSASLGRSVGILISPSARSTSSRDLLSLATDLITKPKVRLVTEKLHEVFHGMHMLESKECRDSFQPVGLWQAVKDANVIFEGNHQQDAHELLIYLLDNIRETCAILSEQAAQNPRFLTEERNKADGAASKLWVRFSSKKNKNKTINNIVGGSKDDASENCSPGLLSNNDVCNLDGPNATAASQGREFGHNFIDADFEGVTVRRTQCLVCESVSMRSETFYDIPVTIATVPTTPNDVGVTINGQCFDTFPIHANDFYRSACVTMERLYDTNKYLCDVCMHHTEAVRTVRFQKIPNLMVLQLKRFTANSGGATQKVNSFVPTPLELECFCEQCTETYKPGPHYYRLCCVIMHLGGTMASGHYIAYVRTKTEHMLSRFEAERSNFFKPWKPKASKCASVGCCLVKMNGNVLENVLNTCTSNGSEDLWLECDDEHVRPITNREFMERLSMNGTGSSTATPYLLLYSKMIF